MNKIKKIIELRCFVVVENGIEKIVVNSYIPFIYLNQEEMIDDNIMEIVQQLATKHRTTFMLRRYVLSDTIEVIEPMIAPLIM